MTRPRAAYRLVLEAGLDLAAVQALLPYLDALGISHVMLTAGAAPPSPAEVDAFAAEAARRGLAVMRDGDDPVTAPSPAFASELEALFVDPAGAAALAELWAEVSGGTAGPPPGPANLPVTDFHAANAARAELATPPVLATTTGGASPSSDVRARLGALSGIGAEWAGAVRRWRADNTELRTAADAPGGVEELLLYLTLIGAFPIDGEQLDAAVVRLARDAGQATAWDAIDAAHEQALLAFTRALMAHGPFRYGFDGWAARVADMGGRATLSQVMLTLTSPGIPELFQGDELELLSLGGEAEPVDWAARASALRGLEGGGAPPREHAKLHVIWRALQLRAELPDAFAGAYTPIPAGDGVCAYLRGTDVLVVAAVRDVVTGASGWALPAEAAGRWRDVLSGAEHELPGGASLAAVIGPEGRALLRRVD